MYISTSYHFGVWGGGITNIKADELNQICTNNNSYCEIKASKLLITNYTIFTAKSTVDNYKNGIYFEGTIDLFINYGTITTYYQEKLTTYTFYPTNGAQGIKTLINYGALSGGANVYNDKSIYITNYGTMGGVSSGSVTIANYGEINLLNGNGKKYHFKDVKSLTLQNYAMMVSEKAGVFNAFNGQNATDNSHLVLDSVTSVSFADKNAKLILDFGDAFEFGAGYKLDKLIVKADKGETALNVDFDRLMPKNDIYTLYKQGDYFIARLQPQHSAISNISKSNIRTMNNFYTMSNSMIYPRKLYHSQNLGKKNPSLQTDSAIPLKSYESFAYRNESINRRIQRQNKRNYNRRLPNQSNSQNLNTDSANKNNLRDSANYSNSIHQTQNLKENQRNSQNQTQNLKENQTFSQNLAQNPNNYYFILTPFFNYNSFAKSGNYNLSGFDYGFLTAFSAKVAESNSLGAHFIFSYGNLGDSKDKDLSIKSLNLNVGLNYKLDLIYDMYLKARGDFFYFSNQVKTLTMFEAIKPNNLGFGVSVIFGKDFNFGKGGILGIEAGIDYKALQSNTITLQNSADKSVSETYQKSLYNLIYVDLGITYAKYFNTSIGLWGLNAGLGLKGNVSANKLAKSQIRLSALNHSVDMVLDNDKILSYMNLSGSYVLNTKNFDMEFSLAYYGNYGNRVISNGGGFEWRVVW